MSDLRLARTASHDWDLEFTGKDLTLGDDLETAVVVSLLTWARRAADDPDPVPNGDPMGWWADETLDPPGDFVGSKWWLSSRSKITPDLFLQLTQWGREALDWMIQDKIAESVTVTPEAPSTRDRVDILVSIQKPGGLSSSYRYELNWQAQTSRGAH